MANRNTYMCRVKMFECNCYGFEDATSQYKELKESEEPRSIGKAEGA